MISYRLVCHSKPLGPIISTFKFGYPHLTLKEGSKVKSVHTRKFAVHDFLLVDFTLQTSRNNNKGDIGTFKVRFVGYFVDDLELRASRSNVCKVVEDMYICYTYHL